MAEVGEIDGVGKMAEIGEMAEVGEMAEIGEMAISANLATSAILKLERKMVTSLVVCFVFFLFLETTCSEPKKIRNFEI